MLLASGTYYTISFAFQYEDIYHSWQSWANPIYDNSAYAMLVLFYFIAVVTPLVILLSGVVMLKIGHLKWYLSVPLILFLALSGLVGKLLLALGAGMYIYNKYYKTNLTSV